VGLVSWFFPDLACLLTEGKIHMNPHKSNSHSTAIPYQANDGYRPWLVFLIIVLVVAGGTAFLLGEEQTSASQSRSRQYSVSNLPSLGGTNSRGNSINDRDWVAGYSTQPTNQTRHAALWRNGNVTDLGTLGGPNSTVAWNVKNTRGVLVGIAQTASPQPLGEA